MLFGHKKKKENMVVSHHILGGILDDSFVRTVKSYDIVIFKKSYSVFLYINSHDFHTSHLLTNEQEKAVSFFIANLDVITQKIELQLKKFFEIEDENIFNEKMNLENITLSSDGKLGAMFSSEFDDEELEKMGSGIDFTDSFGIVFYPEEQVLYNEQECYKFDS